MTGSGEKQAGYVGADDEQEATYSSEENAKRSLNVRDNVLELRHYASGGFLLIFVRIAGCEGLLNLVHLSLGLGEADPGAEPGNDRELVVPSLICRRVPALSILRHVDPESGIYI